MLTANLPMTDVLANEVDRYTATSGDLLVCEGSVVGRAVIWCGLSIGYQKALHRLRARGDDRVVYMFNLLLAANASGAFLAFGSKATIAHLPPEAFREYGFPFAPADEQELILKTIWRETARIDALIARKTRSTELLKEKRQAFITHAVTKKLDSNVRMKDSGVEWIGEVPAHWGVLRIASLYHEAIRAGDQSLLVLSISIHGGVADDELALEDRDRQASQIEDRTKYKRVRPNDLAYNMMRAWQGAFGAVQVEGLVSPAYVVAEPHRELRSVHVEWLLRTSMAVEEMRRHSRGIADFRMRLYWEHFRDLAICLPTPAEQDTSLTAIQGMTTRTDSLVALTKRRIALLKERGAAFITAAATGQVGLRDAVPSTKEAAHAAAAAID